MFRKKFFGEIIRLTLTRMKWLHDPTRPLNLRIRWVTYLVMLYWMKEQTSEAVARNT